MIVLIHVADKSEVYLRYLYAISEVAPEANIAKLRTFHQKFKYQDSKSSKKPGDAPSSQTQDVKEADEEGVIIRLSPEPPSKTGGEQVEQMAPEQFSKLQDMKLSENDLDEKESSKSETG